MLACRFAANGNNSAMELTTADADDNSHGATKSAQLVSERVWTLKELDILHELCKPTVVIASSVYESPHR